MSYRNGEGYPDPTAGQALGNIARDERRERKREKENQRRNDMTRKKVYVASKYAGDIKANTEAAVRCCRYVTERGAIPVASHLMYAASGVLRDHIPGEREMGLSFGLALIGVCDELWSFGEISPGMKQEIREAKRAGIPVRYLEVPR